MTNDLQQILNPLRAVMNHRIRAFLSVLLIISATVAQAQPAFVNVGSSTSIGDNCYLLTPDLGGKVGAEWYISKIDLKFDAHIEVMMNFGSNSPDGADGIAFVLQPVSNGFGAAGSGLGFGGLTPSLGVAFDTYQNPDLFDPPSDHISLFKNGVLNQNAPTNLQGPILISNLKDGHSHPVIIDWNAASQTLQVTLDGALRINYTNNIVGNIFNNISKVFFGFTASTGAFSNNQSVCFTKYTFIEDPSLTWTNNNGDTKWSNGKNWTGGLPPSLEKDIVFNAATPSNADIDIDFIINSLEINSDYKGVVNLNGNKLSVKNGFKVANSKSFNAKTGKLVLLGKQIVSSKAILHDLDIQTPPTDAITLLEDLVVDNNLSINTKVALLSDFGKRVFTNGDVSVYEILQPNSNVPISLTGQNDQKISAPGGIDIEINKITGQVIMVSASKFKSLTMTKGQFNLNKNNLEVLNPVNVPENNRFKGHGRVKSPKFRVGRKGRIAPGNSPDLMTIDGDYTMDSEAVLEYEITDTQHDTLQVTGNVDITGAILEIQATGTPLGIITVIDNQGQNPIVGNFAGYPEGSSVNVLGKSYVISYVGGDGNDITLSNLAPVALCKDIINVNVDNACSATIAVSDVDRGSYDRDGTFTSLLSNVGPFTLGSYNIQLTVTDKNQNQSSCAAIVFVQDNQNPVITAPADITVNADAGQCSASAVVLGTPLTNDNCGVKSVSSNAIQPFAVGKTVVTWTATDNSGNSATATQNVTVIDNQNPTITAPADKTVYADAGKCSASNVFLGTPVTSDNCGVKSVSSYAIQPFAVGKTVVTWTATDVNGNSATATQNVTVIDNQKPTITAPANITVNADAGKCSASNLFLGTPVTSDNCGVKTVISNATQPFTVGTTFVTWTATDNGGNVSTATQKVTVIDIQKPIITAPADITVYAQDDYCTTTAYINSGTPVTGDNCAVKSVINNLPTSLPFGVKTITWTVTDASGNTQTATQKITVLESDKPVILNCPQDITVIIPIKGTCVKVSWTAPTLANYCTKILSFTSSNKPGDLFCKDNNKVSYSATDANGNDSECEFKIKLKTQDNKSDNDAQSARIFTSSATAESNRVRIDFTGNGSDVTDYFSVSKLSVHDSQWSVLDTKKPATNFQLSSYTVYDNAPTEGDNYYRTNEVLNNGNIITGEVQKVYFTSLKGLVVFPNPASDYIDVNLKNYQGKDVTIYLYNQLGVVQVVKQVQKVNGQLPEHIDLNNLNGGTYLFRVESKGVKDAVQSVVIQK